MSTSRLTMAGAGLLLTLLTAGCGSGGDGMTEEQFCADYASRECSKVGVICGVAAADCQPARVAACNAFVRASKSDVREFRPANTTACLDRVSATYSKLFITGTELAILRDVCARVFEGQAKRNEMCSMDYECAGRLICDKGFCGERREVSKGAGCGNPGELCSMGEYCRSTGALWLCAMKKERGSACSATEPCLEGLRCMGTCEPKLNDGNACATDEDCLSGYCSPDARVCDPGLAFAPRAPSCNAYGARPSGPPDAGAPDAGAPDAAPSADASAD